MAMGLIVIIMVATAIMNEMIIHSMQSVRRIEYSNKAYLAAEGGLEDALYELSAHYAGYETKDRVYDFNSTNNIEWKNNWSIISRSNTNEWPTIKNSEKFYKNQKLIIPLYYDSSGDNNNIINNNINTANAEINKQNISYFSITFSIPEDVFDGNEGLRIDNDGDYLGEANTGINEDGADDTHTGIPGIDYCNSPNAAAEDYDCDGLIDEDSEEDPVIMWQLSDGKSRKLIAKKGCITDNNGSQICEKDFNSISGEHSITLNENNIGINENNEEESIKNFINDIFNKNDKAKLSFEFIIVAPMEHIGTSGSVNNRRRTIPYINYKVSSNSDHIPYPYFKIESDGIYNNFKQSISSYVTPKTTIPLFDFTFIQQK